ncbi:CBS domain-containing protein [Flavobacterium psychrophilum]|nr:CBS domain-containing protein [Flavobacterium psychrophilum]
MKNSIAESIANFLKDFKPFSFLSFDDLKSISKTIRVIHLEKNQTLFQINDTLHDVFYVMNSGVIHLSVISDAEETLLNKCYSGDVFGLRPFFAKNNYQMTAKTNEEAILYAIPIESFKPFVLKNTEVLHFLLESFAQNSNNLADKNSDKLISDSVQLSEFQNDFSYFQTLNYNKNPLIVTYDQTIREVAIIMADNLLDAAFINNNTKLVGIVTDADFREKVATGKHAIQSHIDKIMTHAVITVPENISLAEAQLVMLSHKVHHLCVTIDGTIYTQIRGIITQNDLVQAQANSPGVLVKEIKRAINAAQLKSVRNSLSNIIQQAVTKNIPLQHIFNISGEITLAIIRRAIEIGILELGSPPAHFVFLSIGSQGRKEQLLLTDHDSLLIFNDVDIQQVRSVKDYFNQLTKKVNETLEKIGYKHCNFGHNSNNQNYSKSLTEWIKQYESWINTPGEFTNEHCAIFFDYEFVFGDSNLENSITETIYKIKNKALFFDYLGNDALKKPAPLNFFKKFNEEEEGLYKYKFNIKEKGINQLVDIARLLSIHHGLKGIKNTFSRYKELAIKDTQNAEIFLKAADTFLLLSRYRTLEGIKNDNAGEYIDLEKISKSDKEKLKESLHVLKDLEEILKDTFQLTQFS